MFLDHIRVLVGPMPQLLRDILTNGVLNAPDLDVVGVTEDDERLMELCEERRPDVVILQADDVLEARLELTVPIREALRIVAVAISGRSARTHRLRWEVDVVPEVSIAELRAAILGAARPESETT